MNKIRNILGFLVGVSLGGSLVLADTLSEVKKRGFIQCGISQGVPGFSSPDDKGQRSGIDVDYCRAVAAAVFGDDTKVKYTPLSAKERFTALQSGEIDVLSRSTTWTLGRDSSLGVDFAGVVFFDGQGFMVPKKLGVKSVKDLNGATICVNLGTTTELNLADYFRANNMQYNLVTYEKADEDLKAYETGRCDAITRDQSALYAGKSALKNPDEHVILPQVISKEPLGPVVRQGDQVWSDITRWTLFALFEAEELGVTKANVDSFKNSKVPAIQRLLGTDGKMGEGLGLSNDWAYHVVKKVGNYSEIYEKNLGAQSNLKIERAQNNLWNKGGLHYPMPIR